MPLTSWLCAYWPVMKVARAGQHSGKESTASAKVVPCPASRRLTFGMNLTSVFAMSSVITTRMFGRPSLALAALRAEAGAATQAVARRSASSAANKARRGTIAARTCLSCLCTGVLTSVLT